MAKNTLNPILKDLFLDLYSVAVVDGILNKEELKMLSKIGEERGVSTEEFQSILSHPSSERTVLEDNYEKRKYLVDVSKVVISDCTIKDEEIYLWDKIAVKLLGDKKSNEHLKKEIFSKLIEDFISHEDIIKKHQRDSLLEDFNNKINCKKIEFISLEEHEEMINYIKEMFTKGLFSTAQIRHPRIFILGQFFISQAEIKSLLTEAFEKYKFALSTRSIDFAISPRYDDLDGRYKQAITNATMGTYDFLLYGPQPHNIHGKNNESSWETEVKKTSTLVRGNYRSILSSNKIKHYADQFAKSWVPSKPKRLSQLNN